MVLEQGVGGLRWTAQAVRVNWLKVFLDFIPVKYAALFFILLLSQKRTRTVPFLSFFGPILGIFVKVSVSDGP